MPDTHAHGNDFEPTFAYCAREVAEQLFDATVDLSWLATFDMDMIDAAQSFAMYETSTLEPSDGSGTYASWEDVITGADGVGKAIGNIFTVYRSNANESNCLLHLLLFVAKQAYDYGVRDAYESNLSRDTQRRIAKKRARADESRDKMRALYDDIRCA